MRLLKCAQDSFEIEGKLVEPKVDGQLIFVGDTHGDINTSKKVINEYLEPEKADSEPKNTLIFLGDYVDKAMAEEADSQENIDYLLDKKVRYPDNVYLLQGNHEGLQYSRFYPHDFWKDLEFRERNRYAETLGQMPLALSWKNILALHGALPDVERLEDIEDIEYGSPNWKKITWGDFTQEDDHASRSGGREVFDRNYFNRMMERLDKDILIRAHQLDMPDKIYDGRCITLLTTSSHDEAKRIAKIDSKRPNQVEIETI